MLYSQMTYVHSTMYYIFVSHTQDDLHGINEEWIDTCTQKMSVSSNVTY